MDEHKELSGVERNEKFTRTDIYLEKAKNVLSLDVRYIKGVGPSAAQYLYKKDIFCVENIIFSIPKTYENRGNRKNISELQDGEKALVMGKILDAGEVLVGTRTIWKFYITDGTGILECVWFKKIEYLDLFSVGDEVAVFGEVKSFRGKPQMYHPKIVKAEKAHSLRVGKIIPIYTVSDGVDSAITAGTIRKILESVKDYIFSFVPLSIERKLGLMPLCDAVLKVHIPDKYASSMEEIELAKKRIIFEEIFRTQLSLFMKRKSVKDKEAPKIYVSQSLLNFFFSTLPFKPTGAQMRVIEEIRQDLLGPRPMYRLLQGDVGSGKTLVAFAACLMVASSGFQCAVMSPTEILANQLYKNFVELGQKLGLRTCLITGSTKRSERKEIYDGISSGKINVLVGTHALIYDDELKFKNLGLCVIDEQHRFGVLQRLSLVNLEKNYSPHILVMTATPIPRTIALTVWGDLDISILDEFPPGKKPVRTRVFYESKRSQVWVEIERELKMGGKVFIVFPLLRDSEKLDIPSAERMFHVLKERFGNWGVGLIHGKMTGDRKSQIIKEFTENRIRVLVSTTVIEVGIDVPDASMIVIEHAERFGLSQLHQLRGRVGRGGEREGTCILIIPDNISEESERRIRILERESDGFKIAEADLEMRGPGDILGIKQHGFSGLKSEMLKDTKLISLAREIAKQVVMEQNIPQEELDFIKRAFEKFLSEKAQLVNSG